jgi:hypothetical protein
MVDGLVEQYVRLGSNEINMRLRVTAYLRGDVVVERLHMASISTGFQYSTVVARFNLQK